MAYAKMSNKDECITVVHVELELDNKPKQDPKSSYSYNNGLLNQKMKVPLVLGKNKVHYPIEYPKSINSVMVVDEHLKNKVRIIRFDKSSVEYELMYEVEDTTVNLLATGY